MDDLRLYKQALRKTGENCKFVNVENVNIESFLLGLIFISVVF